ncbi:acyloxyacyl hydrolase [Variovorax saccharolyticus]|uniref:acyloxyacyl hydrolase n=1 Tax=Variovorax saccharolyticus TaxID=3053516 RepID=UPI002578E486|nr:acyloxyacyl hydrolase [Variovorax sp. J22R187]MDM0021557.1 acyloxyacyl hydrolase [Variovorax sp. J22R187]
MNYKSRLAKMLLFAGCLSLFVGAAAAGMDGAPGAYIDLGATARSRGDAESFTLGVVLPWSHGEQPVQPRALSFYWDFFLSQWRAPNPDGADWSSYTQLGVIANWRYRFDQGASPWFVEAGVGGTVMDSLYRTSGREFSTTFQFTEQIGLGRSFGLQGEHELSLWLQHFSNAGIKEPNPGENFVRLRYLYRF